MVDVNCINCGKSQRKRERDDNGFNFCCEECKTEGSFKYGYYAKNLYFVINDKAIVFTKNKYNSISGWFIIDKFNLWVLNIGSWATAKGYIENNTVGKLHRFLNNTLKELETDHINRIKHWNTLSNLRNCDRFLNNRNKSIRKDNVSGVVGLNYLKDKDLWKSSIFHNNTSIDLGEFGNPKDAINARIDAELKYWGFSSTKFDENIDYYKPYKDNIKKEKHKDFVAISKNGSIFIYDNQKEFCSIFNLDYRLLNLVLKRRQNSHKEWKFYYMHEYDLSDKEYKDLRVFKHIIGISFGEKISTKKCGIITPVPKFKNTNIGVIFENDIDKNIFYFSKSEILNGNCYDSNFVEIKSGIVGQTYISKKTPYYNLWIKFLDEKIDLDWVYNFKTFKEKIKEMDSFNRRDLYEGKIYFDFNSFVFRYLDNNEIRIRKKVNDQYDFIGEFDGKIYLFDNQNEVCRKYGLDTGALNRCLNGKYKQTKGWEFNKVTESTNLENAIDERVYGK